MEILRAPEGAADGLADHPSERRFVEIPAGDGQQLRVHLVDAGEPEAPVVVFLHGNPSWSFLWRHQIAEVVAAGHRAVAPDLVGMGLSDTPSQMGDDTVARHVDWMRALLFEALDLRDVTLVLHDWGGTIGLRLAADHPERAARIVGWKPLVAQLPGAAGQPHVIVEGAGHFLQEDRPEAYAAALLDWLGDDRERPGRTEDA